MVPDLGSYGIGIFTPTILAAAVGGPSDHAPSIADVIGHYIIAAKGAALITTLLILGILAAVMLADIVGRIARKSRASLAARPVCSSLSAYFQDGEQLLLIFPSFMLFNFMTNLGPNGQTYLLQARSFPPRSAARARVSPPRSPRSARSYWTRSAGRRCSIVSLSQRCSARRLLALPDRDDGGEPRKPSRRSMTDSKRQACPARGGAR
jgi:hypothetical protein